MDIKEIVLKVADSLRNKVDGISHMQSNQGLVRFAEAIISAYKAELLKEAGEPVAVTNQAQLGYVTDGMHPDIPLAMWAKETSYSGANIALYTSDQVAAAIIKATKQLEERRCEICGYAEHHREHTSCLRTQLAAAQEENGRLENQVLARDAELWGRTQEILGLKDQLAKAEQLWQVAQGRCDGLEEKLAKAEQRVAEWQPIETAPKDGTVIMVAEETEPGFWEYEQGFYSQTWGFGGGSCTNNPTHWMPLPKAPNGASS